MSTTAASGSPGTSTSDGPALPASRALPITGVLIAAIITIVVLAAVHLTQGTSTVGALDLLRLLFGGDDDATARVLLASRLPRLLAGIIVGVSLGVAGAALQSVARNPLAAPDTLAVNAGAHLAVVLTAVLGLSATTGLPLLGRLATLSVAFVGGLAAAGLVLLLSAGGVTSPTRLILAGTAIALALNSLTMLLLILNEQKTVGLFAWGSGTLVQTGFAGVVQTAPVVVLGVGGCLLLGRRLDILALGDDTASVFGVPVRQTRLLAILLAVLLCAASVNLAGPIGFVGLCAPAAVRLLASRVPGLYRHHLLLPFSALAGVLIVLAADIAVRAVLGGQAGVDIPTGVVTTIAGAIMLVWLARRYQSSGHAKRSSSGHTGTVRSRRFVVVVITTFAVLLVCAAFAGMLLGDTVVYTGDLVNWLSGRTGPAFTFTIDQRFPRVLAALLAGTALAVAGAAVQSVCRNPLAEPGLLGITAGAGVGAVALITLVPTAGIWTMSLVTAGSALVTFAVVYLLAWRRGGLNSDRLVLIGVGVWMGGNAAITFLIVAFDPWNSAKALTWMSGSTYGRTLAQLAPLAIALVVLVPVIAMSRRELDLLSLDDDTPRVLGVSLERRRLLILAAAALLTATAVTAVGVIGFVGLVAPHLARALVGSRHTRVIPVAALLGALIISLADTIGRTVIAPAQIPAGLLTAMLGTPYFIWLLWRTRNQST